MIVLLSDQLTTFSTSRTTAVARAAAIAASHAPLVAELQASRPRTVHSFETINAFATSLSQAEITSLSARAGVEAVVADRDIRMPRPNKGGGLAAAGRRSDTSTPQALCNTLEPEALQLTKTAFLDPSTPQAQQVLDGQGNRVTGRGVTVGIIADGLDTSVQGFVHTDGSPVFVDYQDFSGDPAGTPTAGGEMFGDASSIAAQDMPSGGALTYDISQFGGAAALPSPCDIRVRGMAPSASLVGLKVFSNLGYTTASSFVQAIDYAVVHDQVDIINESFASSPIGDRAQDPISLANAAATRAGVTITTATGDAGPSTIGSPGTDPNVITAGATTQMRVYAQTGLGVAGLATGWIDDNISAFSSSGFAQRRPRVADLVAPGDLGWALCSTNSGLYQDCGNLSGGPAAIQIFGGTSEAAPLAAGAAALVIQAYRSTHGGQSPSPATIKDILLSSAQDLGAPSDEQGAGRIDALAAVNAALSIQDPNGAPPPHGDGLLASPSAVALTAQPGDGLQTTIQLTNTGVSSLALSPVLQKLGPSVAGQTVTDQLDPTQTPPYITPTFQVPAGVDHLTVSIAFAPTQAGSPTVVVLGLIDPQGRDVASSSPQGSGSGYGEIEVVKPTAGAWTAVLYTALSGTAGSYTGPVQLTWSAENYVSLGSVSPAKLQLPPGGTGWVTASFQAPSQPGDLAAALRFKGAALSEIPVTLRTLIPVGPKGGVFGGTLTGGNARPGFAPTQTFAFDVPSGASDLALRVSVPAAGYGLAGSLVDPGGMLLDSAGNIDASGAAQPSLQLFRATPRPGRWTFVLQELQAGGNQTSVAFSGQVALDSAQVSASGLPDASHTQISAAHGATATVTVTNTGSLSKAYFADARLSSFVDLSLPQQPCSAASTLPGYCSAFAVPTEVAAMELQAQATVPITMDTGPFTGDPDLWAFPVGPNTVAAFLQVPEAPFGFWFMSPALIGPFGPAGAPQETVATTAIVAMQAFDPAVTASSGDFWADQVQGTATFQPLVLAPGASGTITLTIQPAVANVGQRVRGTLYIDTANASDPNASGDEVVALPYAYTIAP
jgi:hypothetical protein